MTKTTNEKKEQEKTKKMLCDTNKIRRNSITKLKAKVFFKGHDEHSTQKSKNYLWIVFFVKKFTAILKAKNIATKLKKFGTYHHKIFSDLVFYENEELQAGKVTLNNSIYRLYVSLFLKKVYMFF